MILKDADDRTGDIAQLQRLKALAPSSFHKAIQKQIDNIYRGIEGEKSAAHFINREFGASERIIVLHDVRIGVDGDFAQIDHLLIHRVQGAAWVLETKNFSGRLTCDEHGDWTVWNGRKPTSIPSPVNQARRHCETLRLWLKMHHIDAIHDIHPVVLISPTSSIKRNKSADDKCVVKSDNFGKWWSDQADNLGVGKILGMMGRAVFSGLSRDEMIVLGKRLALSHVPAVYDYRAMLRLPVALDAAKDDIPAPASPMTIEPVEERPQPRATREYDAVLIPLPPIPETTSANVSDLPEKLETTHGFIHLRKLPDGRIALRNDPDENLIGLVRKACKGRGTWNPRFRNWIIEETDLPRILETL